MLDWFASRFNEPSAAERAKALRLDQKLRKIRGEIDDTRIYVDPFRFGQWLLDNRIEKLGGIFQADKVDQGQIDDFKAFGDFAFNRQPHMQLAIALQNAFSEFCIDKRYGVDSYLGRRIRHGTLKGVMLVQLQSLLQKSKYTSLLSEPMVTRFVDKWFKKYESAIEHWGKDVFQIAAKAKPRGAITTDITSPEKLEVTRVALRDLVTIYKENKSLLQIDQAIFEHCWRLIEKDLQSIRHFIDSQRLSWGTMSRVDLQSVTSEGQRIRAAEFCRELNMLTDEKFRALSRWFTRPTNFAPSATVQLLLDATLDEVKGHFPNYVPKIERLGLNDVELLGMYYHHLYDFMYVVIYNAAKHGKRTGRLVQEIEIKQSSRRQRLEIGISSEISDPGSLEEVQASIGSAMRGDIENAMVVEGQSGIKKLMRMSSDVKEIESIKVSYMDNLVRFECVIELDFFR